MSLRQKIRLLLASARIANVPSVVSNVWLGVALGGVFAGWSRPSATVRWTDALWLALSGALLYVGGNLLNDWHDRDWDAQHRPERALPQQAFAPSQYLAMAVACGLAGVALAWWVSLGSMLVASAIAVCVVGYTRCHKQTAWSILLLGTCRALLPVMFFIEWPLCAAKSDALHAMAETRMQVAVIVPHALALLYFVAGLSLLARYEANGSPGPGVRIAAAFLLVLAGLFMASWYVPRIHLLGILGLLPFVLWLVLAFTLLGKSAGSRVGALLAGIPLLDSVALLPLSLSMISHGNLGPFPLTCLVLPLLAWISGWCLQRFSAAT